MQTIMMAFKWPSNRWPNHFSTIPTMFQCFHLVSKTSGCNIYINEVYYLTGRTERYPPNPALASIALSDARMVLCPAVAVRRVGVAIC